ARPSLLKSHIPGGFNSMVFHAFNGQTVFLKDFKYDDSVVPILRQRLGGTEEIKKLRKDQAKHPYAGTIGVFRADDAEFKPKFPFTPLCAGRYRIRMSV